MPYKIITYETTEQLMHPDSTFTPYRDAIHITATNSLKQGIMNNNDDFCNWIGREVYSFSELSQVIGNGWFSASTELLQYTTLSEVLRQYSDSQKVKHHAIHGAIDKNQETVLSTMRFLRESGITSENLNELMGGTDEEVTLYHAIRGMERMKMFKEFDDWYLAFSERAIDVFEKALVKLIHKQKKEEIAQWSESDEKESEDFVERFFRRKGMLVLHGFYFLMPIQKMIFDRLSKDIEVVHVVNHAEGYARGFEPVEKFLDMENVTCIKALHHSYPINVHAKRFLDVLNGTFGEEVEGYIHRYTNLYQFRKQAIKEDHVLVSPRAGKLKGYMEDPDNPQDLQLSQYPFGRFLLDVHRLNVGRYDVVEGRYRNDDAMTTDLLQRIFNSGFLMVKGESTNRYMKSLKMLSPVLEEKKTFEGWFEALQQIKELRVSLKREFSKSPFNKDSYKGSNLTDHLMYNNPFEVVGHLSVQDEEIDGIIEGIKAIRTLYHKLFKEEKVDIKSYVKILDEHVQSEVLPHIKKEADKQIVESVREALSDLEDSPLEIVQREDLIRGLNFFLGGSSHEDEYAAEMRDGHRTSGSPLVSPMLNSDGLQFDMNRNIHFCLMDQKSFPYVQSLNLWPLKKVSTDKLFVENVNLRQLKMKKDLEFEIACYLFYILMCQAVHIKFSFVQELEQEQGLSPSYYLELMGLKVSRPPEHEEKDEDSRDQRDEYIDKELEYPERIYHYLQRDTALICKKRALYSFFLNDRPVFESKFHGSFTFENLLHHDIAGKSEAGDGRFNLISNAFPHLTIVEKNMLRLHHDAYWRNNEYRPAYLYLDGIKYTDALQRLAIFGERNANTVNPENMNIESSPGNHCKYCPYQMICRDAHVNTR
ncbi:hypothetical protein BW42_03090 [Exiguobacterium sp. RIT341]|nr:hypothetical protein BW42_03090 [Exiguobacterium sp. RIT341]